MLCHKNNLIFVPVLFFVTWFLLRNSSSVRPSFLHLPVSDTPVIVDEDALVGPANSTLGFEAIIALSATGSSRKSKLIQAANVTEIDLVFPELPAWTNETLDNFTRALKWGGRETGRGSKLSWLSHAHILDWFLESGLETALIIEDDVDWDIQLRTVQVPAAATAARQLFSPATSYWGAPSQWDVLWLGHCGDWFGEYPNGINPPPSPSRLTERPHVIFSDPSLPSIPSLHPYTSNLLTSFSFPNQTRTLHESWAPLCTFGYAITRASAARILRDIAPLSRPEAIAFDLAMMHGCNVRGLRCYTLNPEIFHHMPGASLIQEVEMTKKVLPPVDEAGVKQAELRAETSNIGCGFWKGDFYFPENDTARLEWLQEEVGRKGRCIKPGRDGKGEEAAFLREKAGSSAEDDRPAGDEVGDGEERLRKEKEEMRAVVAAIKEGERMRESAMREEVGDEGTNGVEEMRAAVARIKEWEENEAQRQGGEGRWD